MKKMSMSSPRSSSRMRFVQVSPLQLIVKQTDVGGAEPDTREPVEAVEVDRLRQESFDAGKTAAAAEYEKTITELRDQIRILSSELPTALSAYLSELEVQVGQEICELAFSAAEVIIDCQVSGRQVFAKMLDDILEPIIGTEFVLHLHPEDAAWFSNEQSESGKRSIKVIADSALKRGDIVVQTPKGLFDATLHGRVETLKTLLKEHLCDSTAG